MESGCVRKMTSKKRKMRKIFPLHLQSNHINQLYCIMQSISLHWSNSMYGCIRYIYMAAQAMSPVCELNGKYWRNIEKDVVRHETKRMKWIDATDGEYWVESNYTYFIFFVTSTREAKKRLYLSESVDPSKYILLPVVIRFIVDVIYQSQDHVNCYKTVALIVFLRIDLRVFSYIFTHR